MADLRGGVESVSFSEQSVTKKDNFFVILVSFTPLKGEWV